MNEIFVNPTSPLQQLNELREKSAQQSSESHNFADILTNALSEVDAMQKTSNQQVEKILSGDLTDVHSAMVAMQKADLSFQMMMQVRNKLVEAYHEIMRMQV